MKWYRSLRTKLTLILMAASLAATCVTSVAFVALELYTRRSLLVDDITAQAELLARNCQAALAFRVPEDADAILNSLKSKTDIAYACIFDAEGDVFAQYRHPRAQERAFLHESADERHVIRDRTMHVYRDIYLDEKPVGAVYIQADMKRIYSALRRDMALLGLVLLLGALVAFVLSARLQRLVSKPVLALAETAGAVSHNNDYSVRAEKKSGDEIGVLIDAFNTMLNRIQEHEVALNASTERFRSLVETTSDWIWETDAKGYYTYASPAIQPILGYRPEDIIGRRLSDFMPEYESAHAGRSMRRRMKSCKPIVMFETKQLHRNGGLVVMETSGVPFFDGSGTLLGYRGVARDVTERRQLVSELANKTRELESFVYTVSHDLKAPLVSLGGFSSLLVNRYGDMLDADGRHYLERIQANTAHMGRMIAELLELSRIGRVVGDRSAVNMDELAAKVREDLRPELELRNIDLRILSPLPRPVADRDRIAQVLENLFSNAIQFMGDQQEPAIEAGSSGQQSGKYLFFVRDNGIGIEPEYYEKIFQLFQRLNDIDTDGTGIGLAIVKRVIEHHGGSIWVESQKGEGSTFFFTLPAE